MYYCRDQCFGPLLSIICRNNLAEKIKCISGKRWDITKLGEIVRREEDKWYLRGDIDALNELAST